MDGKISIKYLQHYIKARDYHSETEAKEHFFLKLAEEVGELAQAIRKGLPANRPEDIKGTVDEEIYDVIYYAMALANCYGIDLEQTIPRKAEIANQKYPSEVVFEENR